MEEKKDYKDVNHIELSGIVTTKDPQITDRGGKKVVDVFIGQKDKNGTEGYFSVSAWEGSPAFDALSKLRKGDGVSVKASFHLHEDKPLAEGEKEKTDTPEISVYEAAPVSKDEIAKGTVNIMKISGNLLSDPVKNGNYTRYFMAMHADRTMPDGSVKKYKAAFNFQKAGAPAPAEVKKSHVYLVGVLNYNYDDKKKKSYINPFASVISVSEKKHAKEEPAPEMDR